MNKQIINAVLYQLTVKKGINYKYDMNKTNGGDMTWALFSLCFGKTDAVRYRYQYAVVNYTVDEF